MDDIILTPVKSSGRNKRTTKTNSSSMNKVSMDPFRNNSVGGPTQPAYGSENGYRSREVGGLTTGPFTTNILNAPTARKRSRYAVATNPHAKRAIDILVSNVVGSGHRMVSLCPDEATKKIIQKAWEKWCKECDSTGQLPFGGCEALAFRSAIEGGDGFVRLRNRRPEDGLTVPLQIQLLESEQVPYDKNEYVGDTKSQRIIAGIQYDAIGRPIIYHTYKNHPGDYLAYMNDPISSELTVPVPAADMLHLHEIRRPLDGRGLPFLAQMVIRLSDFDRYLDAELVRKKAAALIGGFIRTPQNGAMDNPFLTDRDEDDLEPVEIEALEPGSFPILPPGYEVSFSQPVDVGQNFQVFLKQMLMTIAASMNITYEQLSGDLQYVNDRTLRASMLEFKRFCISLQDHMMVHQFCQPIYDRWFTTAVLSGAIKIPAGMEEDDARAVMWIPDPWSYLNPVQDIQAEKEEIRAGLKTYDAAIMERGGVPEEHEKIIAAAKKRHDALNLVFDTDSEFVSKAGVGHAGGNLAEDDGEPTKADTDAIAKDGNPGDDEDDDAQPKEPPQP